jgi:sulfatase maturation enzyme AslB (radical SAM superfamily)
MSDLYCSMIHGGLELNFKGSIATAQHCCLRKSKFPVNITTNFWDSNRFNLLRENNKNNKWDIGCSNCQRLENSGHVSMRQGMNDGLGIQGKTDLLGPARIDLMFDTSCNLACRSCGPWSSTFWQKHLKEHGEWHQAVGVPQQHDNIIRALSKLDLSNLRMLVFCGGETLLGQAYWEVAKWLADNVPNAKEQLTLCFQTNGTQPIHSRNHELIDRFHLVKLHVSLDGTKEKFEYLRWPATWEQVVDNIMHTRETAPSNLMFHIEETVSIFNLFYLSELEDWVLKHFTTNREGDVVNHTRHLANGIFSLDMCSQEYATAIQQSNSRHLMPTNWKESPKKIQSMIDQIKKFDQFRSQSFAETFPEVAKFYSRFL